MFGATPSLCVNEAVWLRGVRDFDPPSFAAFSTNDASALVWRLCPLVHLLAIGGRAPKHQMVPIAPADLEAALAKDYKQP